MTGPAEDSPIGWLVGKIAAIAEPPRALEDVGGDQRLREDLAVDSLAFIELMVSFEERFELRLDERDLLPGRYHTVAELIENIAKQLPRSGQQ